MIRRLFFALLPLIPAQALALSCMMPDLAWPYQFYDEAEETYGVFAGTLIPQGPLPEVLPYDEEGPGVHTSTYGFEGVQILLQKQHAIDLSLIELRLECAGPWCPNFPQPSQDVLAFIEVDADGVPETLHIGACGGSVFEDTPENRAQVQACMRGEACMPKY